MTKSGAVEPKQENMVNVVELAIFLLKGLLAIMETIYSLIHAPYT